jgi:hypothetical protein
MGLGFGGVGWAGSAGHLFGHSGPFWAWLAASLAVAAGGSIDGLSRRKFGGTVDPAPVLAVHRGLVLKGTFWEIHPETATLKTSPNFRRSFLPTFFSRSLRRPREVGGDSVVTKIW